MSQHFVFPVRVYYEDTDAGGVVYHANYLKFFERARTELLRHWGYEQDVLREKHGVIFAVRSMQIDYMRPARFNDALSVSANLIELKKASLLFAQTIQRNDIILCECQCRIACVNIDKMKPMAIPEFLLTRFTHIQ
jgi:acyl-CoA thioester hydrolase